MMNTITMIQTEQFTMSICNSSDITGFINDCLFYPTGG